METRENFCPVCLAAPFAFAGIGSSVASGGLETNKNDEYKRKKKMLFWGGIVLSTIALAILVYYYQSCDQCIPPS